MKQTLKTSLSLFGYIFLAGIMCIITYLSMKMIYNFVFTEAIGYDMYGTIGESEKKEYLYTYLYEDGKTDSEDDVKQAEYEEQGYTLYKYAKRSELTFGKTLSMGIISQIFCLFFVGTFVFRILTKRGGRDGNLVRIGQKKADTWRGLRITLISCLPAIITYVIFLIGASGEHKGVVIELYVILNAAFWPIFDLIMNGTKNGGDVALWQYIVLFLLQTVIPAMGAVSYYCGYKDYEFLSKLLYKKKG